MMGPTKLRTIRAELRKAFKMSDGKLLVWFNQQMKALEQKPKNQTEMDTLRLLRAPGPACSISSNPPIRGFSEACGQTPVACFL